VSIMNDQEIKKLLEDNERIKLPEVIMHREFALGLVKSHDPMFLLKVPQPFRDGVIELGLSVNDEWYEISNNGTIDYSEYAKPLNILVKQFLNETPVGEYVNFKHNKNT
jgi:hypothetical protein